VARSDMVEGFCTSAADPSTASGGPPPQPSAREERNIYATVQARPMVFKLLHSCLACCFDGVPSCNR